MNIKIILGGNIVTLRKLKVTYLPYKRTESKVGPVVKLSETGTVEFTFNYEWDTVTFDGSSIPANEVEIAKDYLFKIFSEFASLGPSSDVVEPINDYNKTHAIKLAFANSDSMSLKDYYELMIANKQLNSAPYLNTVDEETILDKLQEILHSGSSNVRKGISVMSKVAELIDTILKK